MMEEVLSQIWDAVGDIFGGMGRALERSLTSLFGSSNARYIKKMQPMVDAIGALEPKYQAMTDAELKEQTAKFRKRLAGGETLDDLLVEAYAVCREAGRRNLGMRHFDVQLMGGIVLHRGNIAEMVTGEGKTLVATLPAYLNALEGKGVHVVTVNDYLARRDMEWMGPLYMSLGLTVNAIQSQMDAADRQKAYACDITYGTNNEFGFDYLRDNMRDAARDDDRFDKHRQQVQGPLNYAIIDEVDNILIDEARTPLIISGPAHDDVTRYAKADRIARQLKKGPHFEVNEKEHTAHLTDEGVRAAEQLAGVESFYTAGHMEWPHLIDNSLKAHHLYKRDVNYIVNKEGEVVIVDEFTGRLMPGRNWSDGLHQAVEAKEGVRIKEEYQTLATITLQNFFKLYKKICGMTGTAMTEANEFWKVYKLDVIAMPTNRKMQRINHPDVIYRSEREKYEAIADEIERMNKWDVVVPEKGDEIAGQGPPRDGRGDRVPGPRDPPEADDSPQPDSQPSSGPGRPILVGTVSIERSEMISRHARTAGRAAPGAQCQASPARGGNHRPGRAQRGRDHRHEHGRPRHRHHPRRQSRGHGLGPAPDEISHETGRPARGNGRPDPRDRTARADEARRPRSGRDGRPARAGQRAARGPPHRPPAPRPLRPPGRCRQQPLLSLAGRRPDAEVRRRVGQELAHPAGHAGGRSDREQDGFPPHRGRPEEGRRAELRSPQEPPGIRRGHGRAAEAGLWLSAADPGRRQLQATRAGHDPPADRRPPGPVPGPRLRHGNLRQVGRQGVVGGVRRPRFPRPRFPGCPALCHGPGRAEGRGPDHGRPGREPSHRRRRQERLELGGPGQVRQHPLAHGPPRPRVEAGRPRATRYVSPGEGHGGHRQGRSRGRPRVPRGRLRRPRGLRLGEEQVRHRTAVGIRAGVAAGRVQETRLREGRGRLSREGDRVSGDGRPFALHDPRRRRPQALRPRRPGRSGPASGSTWTSIWKI